MSHRCKSNGCNTQRGCPLFFNWVPSHFCLQGRSGQICHQHYLPSPSTWTSSQAKLTCRTLWTDRLQEITHTESTKQITEITRSNNTCKVIAALDWATRVLIYKTPHQLIFRQTTCKKDGHPRLRKKWFMRLLCNGCQAYPCSWPHHLSSQITTG